MGGTGREGELDVGIYLPNGFLQVGRPDGQALARVCGRAPRRAGVLDSHLACPKARGGSLPFEVSQVWLSLTLQTGVSCFFFLALFFFENKIHTCSLFH